MILKQINCRKNWVSTFRRFSNYLTTELDQWDDLIHVGANCREANGVRTTQQLSFIQENRLRSGFRHNRPQSLTYLHNISLPH